MFIYWGRRRSNKENEISLRSHLTGEKKSRKKIGCLCGILFSNSSRKAYAFYKRREDENNINKILKNRITFK